jgi:hypothetical protein
VGVAEVVESRLSNPLSGDNELLQLYMTALDTVLGARDVRRSFDEFGLSAGILRMKMVHDAQRVLGTATREFTAYQNAVASELSARAVDHTMTTQESRWSLRRWLRALTGRLVSTDIGEVLRGGVPAREFSPAVENARNRLMAVITETELLAQVRTFINTARQSRFGHAYSVASSPALSEVYDSANKIPTKIESELAGLLDRLDGASIGVAGARGAGKSTLIRGYCDEADPSSNDLNVIGRSSFWGAGLPGRSWGDLRCMTTAPVDYVARDFVLHLFATFCGTVISSYSKAGNLRGILLTVFWVRRIAQLCASLVWQAIFFGGYAAILLYLNKAIARELSVPATWVRYAGIALIAVGVVGLVPSSVTKVRQWSREANRARESSRGMIAAARKHLSRVRYLQTYTSGWSGSLGLPRGGSTQLSRSISRAEQPLSHPEIVSEFRSFATMVAADVHRRGDRVFIGVDELDKMGSAEQAEHFLNEVKGIFGIPHLYFMVSVSDDALNAFERRGLPLRDAFDSSFDEILRVEPLSYSESRRLLYRRVIGLTEPYVALCHCLGGGLARDVIRAARQVARNAASLIARGTFLTASSGIEDSDQDSAAYELRYVEAPKRLPALSDISAVLLHDELRRKLRALSQVVGHLDFDDTTDLQDTLHDIAVHLAPDQPIINIVGHITKPGNAEPPAVAKVRFDLAAYAYYCATLQEVFTDRLDDAHMVKAASKTSGPGSFDALAEARNTFTTDTLLAWNLVTQCRDAWSLQAREPARSQIYNGQPES